jgi:kynureninase
MVPTSARNPIVTDVRGTRLRLGFGLYHTSSDVERLVSRLRNLA